MKLTDKVKPIALDHSRSCITDKTTGGASDFDPVKCFEQAEHAGERIKNEYIKELENALFFILDKKVDALHLDEAYDMFVSTMISKPDTGISIYDKIDLVKAYVKLLKYRRTLSFSKNLKG